MPTTRTDSPAPASDVLHALKLAQPATAQVLLPCEDLAANIDFFIQALGFRVEAIFPADNPRSAIMVGHGLQLRLVRADGPPASAPAQIELLCHQVPMDGPRDWLAPNGTGIRLVTADPALHIPPTKPSLTLSHDGPDALWHVGRAGLRYRDLIPDRHGGAFIASHIRILEGGPVPDYVHFHKVRFQTIYCRKGWVEVVYEDQGEPFVMHAGDCVLQPPMIRHRVLASSAGAEVVEITAPAEHITRADPHMSLPNSAAPSLRDYNGQRFVRHVAATAAWAPWHRPGFVHRDTGIGEATRGLAGVRVVRAAEHDAVPSPAQAHASEFCFYFVLNGGAVLNIDGHSQTLNADASVSIPRDAAYFFEHTSHDFEFLEVTLPADV